jgi:transcriptional regulator with PAS, ATPase and Fis domain
MARIEPVRTWQDGFIPLDETPIRFDRILARAKVMKQVLQRLQMAAVREIPVLILGETGTGKDLIAQSIHRRSQRKEGPYIAVNVAAIPRDLFVSELFGHAKDSATARANGGMISMAERGTLFLDEIDALDLQAQASLLGVLEDLEYHPLGSKQLKKADIRIIAASNTDLQEKVRLGAFRQDLYYRLEAFTLTVPPLRNRSGGIPLLAQEFLREMNQNYGLQVSGIDPVALQRLETYSWPGNVRELKNVIQRAILLARRGRVEESHLPERFMADRASDIEQGQLLVPGLKLKELERKYVKMTLTHCKGNKSRAAHMLGISRKALYAKMRRAKMPL